MFNKQLLTTKDIENLFGVTKHTIMGWRNQGILPYTKINDRKFLYKKEDIEKLLTQGNELSIKRQNVIYCRIWNLNEKVKLERQKEILVNYCNNNGITSDLIFMEIGSGIDENRLKFNKLVNLVISNQVNKIFITNKDILTKIGFNYLKYLFKKFNTEIIILNDIINENDSEQKLIEDLISIIKEFNIKNKIL